MRARIELETLTDVKNFCNMVSKVDVDVFLIDSKNKYKVSAKSIIGCLLAQAEWNTTTCICEKDIYQIIKPWVIEGVSMT